MVYCLLLLLIWKLKFLLKLPVSLMQSAGTITVPAKKFIDIIRSLDDEHHS